MRIKNNFFNSLQKTQQQAEATRPIRIDQFVNRDFVAFQVGQPMETICDIFIKEQFSAAPVFDTSDKLVGIISEGDCLKQLSESSYFNAVCNSKKVEDYMSKDVIIVPHNMGLFELVSLFLQRKKRQFPVEKNGKIIGMISLKKLLFIISETPSNSWR